MGEQMNDYIFNGTPILTTKDNPYDPSTEFTSWHLYDVENGYNSCGIVARLARTSDKLTDEENAIELDRVIDWFISIEPTRNYKKVYAHA